MEQEKGKIEKKEKLLAVKIDKNILHALKILAIKQERSLKSLIDEILQEYLLKNK